MRKNLQWNNTIIQKPFAQSAKSKQRPKLWERIGIAKGHNNCPPFINHQIIERALSSLITPLVIERFVTDIYMLVN